MESVVEGFWDGRGGLADCLLDRGNLGAGIALLDLPRQWGQQTATLEASK